MRVISGLGLIPANNSGIVILRMPSVATIYVVTTTAIFGYTVQDHLAHSDTYFKAMMTYLADPSCIFVLYNTILTLAILLYRGLAWLFFVNTMEGEIIKITDKLKNKIVDLIILAYIIDLKFDFEMYALVVLVAFTFILHSHLTFRSEYLVHVYTASTSLRLHYRALALYLVLFFTDYQLLKFIVRNMLSVAEPTEGIFVYYMVANFFSLLEPFMQFAIDFYEKYTFIHIKNSDEVIATASIFITIPRLVVELILCIWLSLQFRLAFFAIIRGFEIVSNIKKTYDSYARIKKLSLTMAFLKKIKGEELSEFHDLTCTVCYEDMKESVLLPCRHIFHEECIRQWIIKNLNHFCPKCKHELNFDDADALYEKKPVETPLDRMRVLIEQRNKAEAEQEGNPPRQRLEERHNQSPGRNEGYSTRRRRGYSQEGVRGWESQLGQEEIGVTEHHGQTEGRKRESRRKVPLTQYGIDRPGLVEYPQEVYEVLRKKIVPVGALAYGMPSVAVGSRRAGHMARWEEYEYDMEMITRLLDMDRNVQLMLL